ncbi:hypothetical protein MTR67_012282 [Solanum verrucosum]|uniref:Uncharacterized protein n=1 Tax=Solanum verrucosum TaxID=315347 RepID=A0AAF0Q8C0_SOLVR|nr:hypothetical protein MTR67_012282 [Solanum verrucosum]
MLMEGACPHRGIAPPRANSLVHVADSSASKFNFHKLVGTPPGHELVSQ